MEVEVEAAEVASAVVVAEVDSAVVASAAEAVVVVEEASVAAARVVVVAVDFRKPPCDRPSVISATQPSSATTRSLKTLLRSVKPRWWRTYSALPAAVSTSTGA